MKQTHMKLFQQVIDLLGSYNLESVAEAAEVSPTTLYNWINNKVKTPHLRTISNVAQAMGYELILEHVHKLKQVA